MDPPLLRAAVGCDGLTSALTIRRPSRWTSSLRLRKRLAALELRIALDATLQAASIIDPEVATAWYGCLGHRTRTIAIASSASASTVPGATARKPKSTSLLVALCDDVRPTGKRSRRDGAA